MCSLPTPYSYAIFATTGAVSDCGTSHVTGDVGGHTVAPTGFNPLFVSGAIHFNDPSTTAASGDLLLIYNNLLALPYDIKLLDPAGFGHNLVLTPHTYQMDAAVTFTDTVYLDGLGNSNAVFVIKTFGAFASTPNSKVILMNGTQAKNVYWFVTGAVSITANSIFRGAVIAHDAIDILNGSVLHGRAFSTNGAIASCGMTASPPFVTATGPVNQVACEEGSATFSVTISSTAPTFQWRRGTVNLIEGGNLSGTTSSTLTINPVALSDAALNYNVVIAGSVTPAITSADVSLTVYPLPVPAIAGPASVAVNSTGNVYTTETGMTGYTWTVSAGGTITSGAGTATITVTWNTSGGQTVSVTYVNANNCVAAAPTIFNVTVTSLLVPTITGPNSVCMSATGIVYTTETGMTGYVWTLSAGGTITSGAGTNSIIVTWNTAGAQTVGVVYSGATPASYPVTVNLLPVPTLTGPASVCVNSTGNVYTTQAGMTGYTWLISAGGTITAGGSGNAITVSWNTSGPRTVSVNYTNANNCTASTPSVYNVTVNPLPVPAISGPGTVCNGTTGVVYTTQAGMTGYTWMISSGGIITSGSGTNNIIVTWNTAGAQSVGVNYANGAGCTAATAATYPVTVNTLPVPVITGPVSVCINSSGNVYTTEPGMTGYNWFVSGGGTIYAGGASNAISVTWNSAGPKTVSVNYTNANNCTASTPSVYNVTVNSLPVPVIAGPNVVCQSTASVVYATQTGMSGYVWNISAGGTILAGGTPTSSDITVKWNTPGIQAVTVNYTNLNGCTAVTPESYSVTVNPAPTPFIGSTNIPCTGSANNIYYTDAGQSNYLWTVSSGTIVSGQGTNSINVTWTGVGAQYVTVDYNNSYGCPAVTAAVYNVFLLDPPGAANPITGTAELCAGTSGISYSTLPLANATSYSWTVPSGATISVGAGTTNITVNFSPEAVSGNITVTGINNCGNGAASIFPVQISPLPADAGIITGQVSACAGEVGVSYSVSPIAGAESYLWTIPSGAVITYGSGTNHILLSFGTGAGNGVITVKGINACGSGLVSPNYNVAIQAIPATPYVSAAGSVLSSNAPSGNQWYDEGTLIQGATGQFYTVMNNTGYYWCVVTVNGCSSEISNKTWVEVVGTPELPASASFNIYPVPNNGQFNVNIRYPVDDTFAIRVYNQIGIAIHEFEAKIEGGEFVTQIDLRPISNGIYSVIFINNVNQGLKIK